MSDQIKKGGIAWTHETWNPIRGCSRVSEGCWNCYAEAMAGRFCGPGQPYNGLVRIRLVGVPVDGLLDGTVARWWPLAPPRAAAAPLVPAPRTAPSTSLGHQQLGGR